MDLRTRTSSFDHGLRIGAVFFRTIALATFAPTQLIFAVIVDPADYRVLQIRRRRHLRPAQKRAPTSLSQVVDSALDGDEPAINVSIKDFVSVWDRRLEVPWTSRSLCQRGGAGESALAICCHDRRPRSPTFGGIAPAAAVLLDETGSAVGIFARHRCGRTYQDLYFAIRQHPEQAETEPSTKVAKPGVALAPLPARREASGQPNFVAGGRAVDPLQDELEIEGQLEFADHDDGEIVALQRYQIAASNLAFDDKAEPFCAFGRFENVGAGFERPHQAGDGSLGDLAQIGLQLRKSLLDRVHVRL